MADKKGDPEVIGGKLTIIVNGTTQIAPSEEITFDQVVGLAFPSGGRGELISYTVTFYNGGGRVDQGGLDEGEHVKVRSRHPYTVFNVTRTDRS